MAHLRTSCDRPPLTWMRRSEISCLPQRPLKRGKWRKIKKNFRIGIREVAKT
jgi:hypothetical protein